MTGLPWWKSAVIYQIYPRSFADGNSDGVGDLRGITQRLDYLQWLGIDAVWISPFFRSPMKDFGYDVSDYCDVDPVFGSLADFDALVEAAHARDIRVLIDWVPAHSSDQHPWFVEARSARDNPKRDWYVWRDPGPDGELPNNWISAFTRGPAWTLDPKTDQLYLHSFLAEQPDLNWANPEVVAAMHEVLRFWLDHGVDGFRADVVHNIGKDPELRSVETRLAKIPHCALNNEPVTHELLRGIRGVLDGYPGERMMVGEVFLLDTALMANYYGTTDAPELHLNFNFPPMFAPWEASKWREQLDNTQASLDPIEAWPTWALSNHDQPRHRTKYGSEARARAAAFLLLGVRGTPFMYMGEELGLEDAVIPAERVVDPGGRDGCRSPIPWDRALQTWGDAPWLPWSPEAASRSVEAQRDDPGSFLALYRSLLTERRASAALREGRFEWLTASGDVLAFRRMTPDQERIVAINFSSSPVTLELPGAQSVRMSSDQACDGEAFSGRLGADQALLLGN